MNGVNSKLLPRTNIYIFVRGSSFPFPVYPFNPLVLIPSTIFFWKKKNSTIGGTRERILIANIAPQSVMEVGSENSFRATDTVYFFGEIK